MHNGHKGLRILRWTSWWLEIYPSTTREQAKENPYQLYKGFPHTSKLIYLDGLFRLKPLDFFLYKHIEWVYGTTYDRNQLIYMGVDFQLEQVGFKDELLVMI